MLPQTVVKAFVRDRCSKTKQHRNHESGSRAERHKLVVPTLIKGVGVGIEGAVGDEDVGRCKYEIKLLVVRLNFCCLWLWADFMVHLPLRCLLFVALVALMTVLLCS